MYIEYFHRGHFRGFCDPVTKHKILLNIVMLRATIFYFYILFSVLIKLLKYVVFLWLMLGKCCEKQEDFLTRQDHFLGFKKVICNQHK